MKYAFKLKLECVERSKQAIAECFDCPSFRIQDFFHGMKKRFLSCNKAFPSYNKGNKEFFIGGHYD